MTNQLELTHPSSRTMESWRATLSALKSRGETDGPRVDAAESGLSYWRCHTALFREVERGTVDEALANKALDILTTRPRR
ncbi:hypothetical protein [Williamsia maris]|nr:hypothetical protein [Williamsia maris]